MKYFVLSDEKKDPNDYLVSIDYEKPVEKITEQGANLETIFARHNTRDTSRYECVYLIYKDHPCDPFTIENHIRNHYVTATLP